MANANVANVAWPSFSQLALLIKRPIRR